LEKVVTKTTENVIIDEMEEKIIELSGYKDHKSIDRKEQVIHYVYYYIRSLNKNDITNISKLTRGSSLGETISNNIEKNKSKLKNVTEKIQNSFFNKTTLLLNKPIYLQNEFKPKYLDGDKKDNYVEFQNMEPHIKKWKYNYGLSFWVNVHTQGANFRASHNKFTTLLDYSNSPKISYNPSEDKLRVQVLVSLDSPPYNKFKDNKFSCKEKTGGSGDTNKFLLNDDGTTNKITNWDPKFTKAITDWCKEDMTKDFNDLEENSSILLTVFEKEGLLTRQKWNNIVFNYDLGKMDIFVNGKLEGVWNNEIQFMKNKTITIGEKDGISGGICNVAYYPSALTKTQIEFSYNVLKLKNPPII